uniref:Uncharacterized protein n=1 Tax=uncultured marine virus TaxID=186617 RepID=A0A0F7L574_9VIRU|nr:hypothetical protein [uncultured marine virus]
MGVCLVDAAPVAGEERCHEVSIPTTSATLSSTTTMPRWLDMMRVPNSSAPSMKASTANT